MVIVHLPNVYTPSRSLVVVVVVVVVVMLVVDDVVVVLAVVTVVVVVVAIVVEVVVVCRSVLVIGLATRVGEFSFRSQRRPLLRYAYTPAGDTVQ